jgi:hypothetical protein
MLVTNGKRTIDVPAIHFMQVLSKQGWNECPKTSTNVSKVGETLEPSELEKESISMSATPKMEKPIVEKSKPKRGRPPKVVKEGN